MAQKRYLIFGDGYSPHLFKWAKELNLHFDLYLLSSTGISDPLKNLLPENKRFELGFSTDAAGGNYKVLKKIGQVKKVIKSIDPHFVNPHYLTSHGFMVALLKQWNSSSYKLIQSAWGTDILVTPFRSTIYKKLTKFALKKADLITSDSRYMSEIIASLGGKNIETFPFGLDKIPDAEWQDKEPGLFFSNRALEPNYNIPNVIKHFSGISQNNDNKLVIANLGSELERCKALVEELKISDRVKFVGFLSAQEQSEFYRRAQFYISIPTSDATAVSLLEAMAFGAIPILSDLPANREWIVDGESGLIGVDSLAERCHLLAKKGAEIFDRNRKTIAERAIFSDSIASFVKKIVQLSPQLH